MQAYKDTGLSPEECAEYAKADKEGRYIVLKDRERQGVDRLREIAKADVEGRLVILPCRVGDEVWFDTWEHGIKNVGIRSHKIDRVDITLVSGINELVPTDIPLWELGKTVFFTPEAAKKALEEKK